MCWSRSSMRNCRIITAPSGGGKTHYILSCYTDCEGFVTTAEDESKKRLFLENLKTGHREVLMERTPQGPYMVHQNAFDLANEAVCRMEDGLVVLDECGWMETEKRGFYPALEHIRQAQHLDAVLSVRLDRLEWYLDFFALTEDCVFRL